LIKPNSTPTNLKVLSNGNLVALAGALKQAPGHGVRVLPSLPGGRLPHPLVGVGDEALGPSLQAPVSGAGAQAAPPGAAPPGRRRKARWGRGRMREAGGRRRGAAWRGLDGGAVPDGAAWRRPRPARTVRRRRGGSGAVRSPPCSASATQEEGAVRPLAHGCEVAAGVID